MSSGAKTGVKCATISKAITLLIHGDLLNDVTIRVSVNDVRNIVNTHTHTGKS